MTTEEFEAFKKAWEAYPTQDNGGFQPDRGSFKSGFMAGAKWEREQCAKLAESHPYEDCPQNYGVHMSSRCDCPASAIAQSIRARGEK